MEQNPRKKFSNIFQRSTVLFTINKAENKLSKITVLMPDNGRYTFVVSKEQQFHEIYEDYID